MLAALSAVALADIPPEPGYVEKCTIQACPAGSEAKTCGASYRGSPECDALAEQGFAKQCSTWGGSFWTEVMCKAPPPPPPKPRAALPWPKLEFVSIPAGTFTMGGPADEPGHEPDEPRHDVAIAAFRLMKHEVTQAEWEAVMHTVPSAHADCPSCPVETVSWDDANAFAAALSDHEGLTGAARYRLPTEAEWEHAARAGQSFRYAGSDDLDAVAWYDGNSGGETHPVCTRAPNGWGLCDLTGNVWEWTADWSGPYPKKAVTNPTGPETGTERVFRGECYGAPAEYQRLTYRTSGEPTMTFDALGFRLARSAP
jgi:formylglycine-generating enzyme required for sulfatase activity